MKYLVKSKFIQEWQEKDVVRMYKKGALIKECMEATGLSRNLVGKIIDAHGIRHPQYPQSNGVEEVEGSIIQQCANGASEDHKKLCKLFKPSKL